jgi:hypothetical protein
MIFKFLKVDYFKFDQNFYFFLIKKILNITKKEFIIFILKKFVLK